jgi:hypothetical protein
MSPDLEKETSMLYYTANLLKYFLQIVAILYTDLGGGLSVVISHHIC